MNKEITIDTDLFLDTSETLFGQNIFKDLKGAAEFLTFSELSCLLDECCIEANKIDLNIVRSKIKKIEIVDTVKIVGGVKPIGQNEYLFVVSKYVLNKMKTKYLYNMIYHELCHLYQLNILFNKKIIYWNYGVDKLRGVSGKEEDVRKHLQTNTAHTEYWQFAANKINNSIKLEIPVKAILDYDELVNLFLENFFKAEEDNDFNIKNDLIE